MIKLIAVITLSISVLIPSLFPQIAHTNEMICRVSNSTYQEITNTYSNTIINEDGEEFRIMSYHDMSGKWLGVFTKNGTNSIKGYDVLKDDNALNILYVTTKEF
ncbi:MAG TPA: hypothetical protein VIM70_12470 [Clostridium sp.]|uniref:hypothetical protein n=1 Tax=Clostridium sp. TaxID=1506 RepID=UPI002F94AE3F